MNGASDLSFEIDGLRIRALAWGDPSQPPVLALHGWLDNAASFARLAPLLHGYYVVAPDLPGHGQSSHHSLDSGYQIWEDLAQLRVLPDHLGWERFSIIGHSRGAMISSLLAAVVPERVTQLVLLDGMLPEPLSGKEFVKQLRKHYVEREQLLQRDNRIVKGLSEAALQREQAGAPLPHAAAMLLAQRGTRDLGDGKLQWTSDPRLRGASSVKLTASQRLAVLEALHMPVLLLLASEGLKAQYGMVLAETGLPEHTEVQELPGGHHFHMEDEVELLATAILQFFAQGAS